MLEEGKKRAIDLGYLNNGNISAHIVLLLDEKMLS